MTGDSAVGWCRLQDALEDFEQAVSLEPNNALSHNARGLLLEKIGRPDAALADFEKAVQLDGGTNVDFLRNRGLCFRARRDYNKAVEDFDRCFHTCHNTPNTTAVYSCRVLFLSDQTHVKELLYSIQLF